jgi:hypothetical protein
MYNKSKRKIGYANVGDAFNEGMARKKKYALYISYTEVYYKWQHKGYGQQLYRKIFKYAQQHHYTKIKSTSISEQAQKARSVLTNKGKPFRQMPVHINVPKYKY